MPGTAVPRRARSMPRTATAGHARRAARPRSMTSATTPTEAYRPSMNGTSTKWPPAASAASAAALASSDSRAMVNTMPGSTTPEVSGSRGRFWLFSPSVLRLICSISLRLHQRRPPRALSGVQQKMRTPIPLATRPRPTGPTPGRGNRGIAPAWALVFATARRSCRRHINSSQGHQMFVLRSWQVRRTFTSDGYGSSGSFHTIPERPPWWAARRPRPKTASAEYG